MGGVGSWKGGGEGNHSEGGHRASSVGESAQKQEGAWWFWVWFPGGGPRSRRGWQGATIPLAGAAITSGHQLSGLKQGEANTAQSYGQKSCLGLPGSNQGGCRPASSPGGPRRNHFQMVASKCHPLSLACGLCLHLQSQQLHISLTPLARSPLPLTKSREGSLLFTAHMVRQSRVVPPPQGL